MKGLKKNRSINPLLAWLQLYKEKLEKNLKLLIAMRNLTKLKKIALVDKICTKECEYTIDKHVRSIIPTTA